MCIRLIVDPPLESKPPGVQLFVDEPEDGQAILTPLAGPTALVTALAPDGLRLRRLLDNTARMRPPRRALTDPPPTVGAQHGLARIDFTGQADKPRAARQGHGPVGWGLLRNAAGNSPHPIGEA